MSQTETQDIQVYVNVYNCAKCSCAKGKQNKNKKQRKIKKNNRHILKMIFKVRHIKSM